MEIESGIYSSSTLLGLVCLLVTAIFYSWILFPLYISPLSRVPGPKLAALSVWYLDSRYWSETAAPFLKELHRKYGPIVRVGPAEVVVDDPRQIQTIYGVRSAFPKPPTAALFQSFGAPNAFSAVTREEHRERRRRVAKVYTMSSLLNNQELVHFIQNRMDKVMTKADNAPHGRLDIYQLSAHFALDNVSYMVFGESVYSLEGNNLSIADSIRLAAIASCPNVRSYHLLNLLSPWPFNYLMPAFLTRAQEGRTVITDVIEGLFVSLTKTGKKCSPHTAIGCIQHDTEYGTSISDRHALSEGADHIYAGADTTAAAISYMFYTLAQPENAAYQKVIFEEVSKLSEPLDYKEICNLPQLNIFLLESLRLYTPGPGSLQQRMTPPGTSTVLEVQGKTYELPANTQIGIQAYSIHRNPKVYGEDCDRFRPARWEEGDEAQQQLMKEAWIPFGSGARVCLGMHLAIIELKVLTASMLRNYTIEIPPNANPDDMIPLQAAVIRPKAERCDLIFKKRI